MGGREGGGEKESGREKERGRKGGKVRERVSLHYCTHTVDLGPS